MNSQLLKYIEGTMYIIYTSTLQFGFAVFWHWEYSMKVIPETRRVH